MKEAAINENACKIAKWKDFVSKNFTKMEFSGQKGFYIFAALLLSILFIFDRPSAINFMKILIIIILSSKVMREQFSHIPITLSKDGNRIFEYALSVVFSIFIFVEIDFLLNRLYTHALLALIFLLGFVIAFFNPIEKRKRPNTNEGKKQAKY